MNDYLYFQHKCMFVCRTRGVASRLRSLVLVCLSLTSPLNIGGHIATVPACSSGTLTNVLPHRNDIPPRHSIQTRGRTVAVLSIDVERHMWNVTLEYTATHF